MTHIVRASSGVTVTLGVCGILAMIDLADPQASFAQSASAPKFEVASIRPSKFGLNHPVDSVMFDMLRTAAHRSEHGRFWLPDAPLNVLIQLAYDVNPVQVLGTPAWAASDRYEIDAKAEGDVNFGKMRPMLQSLLADRFKLAFHRETIETSVYELVVAKGGFKLEASKDGNCNAPDPNGPPAARPLNICGIVSTRIVSPYPQLRHRLEASAISMPKLVEIISDDVGRIVIDKTGFKGLFELKLEFAPSEAAAALTPAMLAGLGKPDPSDPSGPSIFNALQQQLGLRLVPAKGPVEALVVDHVEKPSEN
jgi:uncharacterized protein (TIGR03435 family)